ncbi:hypothetical protein [Prescottella agglutinans]|uniref:hypothetical protein n=1 Tax=Prescottella agglutinans TaxID=1644129 RepID=UPI003D982B04
MNLESSFEEVSDSALSFDKSALSEPVDRSVVHAEFREMYDGGARARGRSSSAWFSGIGSAVDVAFLAASLILILAMIVRLLTDPGLELPYAVIAWSILALPYAYRRIARFALCCAMPPTAGTDCGGSRPQTG